jgi:hypothetical protein
LGHVEGATDADVADTSYPEEPSWQEEAVRDMPDQSNANAEEILYPLERTDDNFESTDLSELKLNVESSTSLDDEMPEWSNRTDLVLSVLRKQFEDKVVRTFGHRLIADC